MLRDTARSRANTLLTGINDGKGSLGKLVKDDTTTNDLDNLLTETTKLVSTIRADPKKYLTIHLKIF